MPKLKNIDLHNHTTLCNHAEGTPREYILEAIKQGITTFGFSDHAPMDFDPKYRMKFEEMQLYKSMVDEVKKEFESQIEILFAYEVDYLQGHIDRRILEADVDYLIGSVHFVNKWGFDNPEFIGKYDEMDIDEIWHSYFAEVEAMAKTGYFDIVGHLDLIKVFKFLPSKSIADIALPALKAIKEADMTLEINGAGYRKPIGEAYPSRELLEKAFELNIPITFASDAHSPEQVGLFTERTHKLAHEVGYKECATYKNRIRSMVQF